MNQMILSPIGTDELKQLLADVVCSELKKVVSRQVVEDAKKSDVEYLSVKQVAELLGKSMNTIHNWKNRGILPFHKVSNKIFFKKTEVLATIEGRA